MICSGSHTGDNYSYDNLVIPCTLRMLTYFGKIKKKKGVMRLIGLKHDSRPLKNGFAACEPFFSGYAKLSIPDESLPGSRALNGAAYLIVVFPDFLHIVPVVLLEAFFQGFAACIIGGEDVIPEDRFLVSPFRVLIPEVV